MAKGDLFTLEQLQAMPGGEPAQQTRATASEAEAERDSFGADLVQGVAKSGGDIGLGIGEIGRKIQGGISFLGEKVFGSSNPFKMSEPGLFDKGSESNIQAREALSRNSTAEKIGGFVGDVASFAVPSGAVVKGSKGANLLTRAGTLGASDALVTGIREGEFDRDAVDSAIIGAAFPVAGKVGSAAKALLPSTADAGAKVINSLVKPLLKDFSYGKNPGKAVAEAGIVANSLDDLAVKIKGVKNSVGQQISDLMKTSSKVFDVSGALDPIDDAITKANNSPRTNAAIITRLQNLKDDILRISDDVPTGRPLNNLSAEDVFELKREIGDLTRWTGNATDDEIVNKALKTTYGNLKSTLDDSIDGIRGLNEKYANLLTAETATIYRDKIAARQGLISFSGMQLGTAAAVASAIVSGGAVVPILVGAGAGLTTEALKTPAVKTRIAAWLASASRKEIKDAFLEAPWLRGAIQSALLGED